MLRFKSAGRTAGQQDGLTLIITHTQFLLEKETNDMTWQNQYLYTCASLLF